MGMNEKVNKFAATKLQEMWGGRWPTWDEFREATAGGRVRVNKTIAAEAIYSKSVPIIFRVFYGAILLWLGFLSLPITVAIWFFADVSAWWIAGGAIVGWFLVKVSREGHCEGIKLGAEKDEQFYQMLAESGAFLFEPKQQIASAVQAR